MARLQAAVFIVSVLAKWSSGLYVDRNTNLGIVGGLPISIEDAPYMAAVFVSLGGFEYFCGGTIIHKRFILTAYHCFGAIVPDPRDIKVLVGASYLDEKDGVIMDVEKKICHEKGTYNDICLLKLKEPVYYGEKMAIIALPKKDFELDTGVLVNLTGWGATDKNEHHHVSDVLRQSTIPIKSQESCRRLYINEVKGSEENFVCAGSRGHDSCHSDGGSPLTLNGVQVGIARYWNSCGLYPSVYIRVTSYVHWIRTKIRENL